MLVTFSPGQFRHVAEVIADHPAEDDEVLVYGNAIEADAPYLERLAGRLEARDARGAQQAAWRIRRACAAERRVVR